MRGVRSQCNQWRAFQPSPHVRTRWNKAPEQADPVPMGGVEILRKASQSALKCCRLGTEPRGLRAPHAPAPPWIVSQCPGSERAWPRPGMPRIATGTLRARQEPKARTTVCKDTRVLNAGHTANCPAQSRPMMPKCPPLPSTAVPTASPATSIRLHYSRDHPPGFSNSLGRRDVWANGLGIGQGKKTRNAHGGFCMACSGTPAQVPAM